MGMQDRRAWVALSRITIVACMVMLAASAQAQPCADPDGDGDITEADGVITLLAAAGGETACSLTICDINIDGVINDTDAVLVFRKAAELEVEDNCIETSGGPVDQRVVILVQRVLPFLQEPFQFVPQINGLPTPGIDDDLTEVSCDNFSDDGLVETGFDGEETAVAFVDCLIGNTNFDGEILDGSSFDISMEVLDRLSDEDITYEGESLLVSDTGSALRISGEILASPFFEAFILEDAGDFVLDLFNLEITFGTTLLNGRATLDLLDTELPGLRRIAMEFDGTTIVIVTVTDDNATDRIFLYDLDARRFL